MGWTKKNKKLTPIWKWNLGNLELKKWNSLENQSTNQGRKEVSNNYTVCIFLDSHTNTYMVPMGGAGMGPGASLWNGSNFANHALLTHPRNSPIGQLPIFFLTNFGKLGREGGGGAFHSLHYSNQLINLAFFFFKKKFPFFLSFSGSFWAHLISFGSNFLYMWREGNY